jgi:uncharacterized protein (DUF779 family)
MGSVRVTGTDRAVQIIERAKVARRGTLTITIGTGCCESTAPFLYEDFWPGPDQEVVGQIAGVEVFAPQYLRSMYPGDDGVVVDVYNGPAESMSVETEWDCRLFLRGHGVDAGEEIACEVPTDGPGLLARQPLGTHVRGELPEQLRNLRLR